DQVCELEFVGPAARHGIAVTVLVEERRRQTEGAGVETLAQHVGDGGALVGRGRPLPRLVAHDVGPQVGATDEGGDIDGGAVDDHSPSNEQIPRHRGDRTERFSRLSLSARREQSEYMDAYEIEGRAAAFSSASTRSRRP